MSRLPLIGTRACIQQGARFANHACDHAPVNSSALASVSPLQWLSAVGYSVQRLAEPSCIDSPSVIHTIHYSRPADRLETVYNRLRAPATLPFIRAVVAPGEPVSAIGRCFEQVSAAFIGGARQCTDETRRYTSTVFAVSRAPQRDADASTNA